jgi:hypothetical protein
MKACETCITQRAKIGCNHQNQSVLARFFSLILIYLPILTWPFMWLSAYMTYFSLKLGGAENLKTLGDYLPDRASHRYDLKSQIVMNGSFKFSMAQSRLFWILNCTWYCPYSVALLEWHTYLVKIVENWWCPFGHSRKNDYGEGAIDQSFWHIYPEEIVKLHPDDRNNPIFTEDEDSAPSSSTE